MASSQAFADNLSRVGETVGRKVSDLTSQIPDDVVEQGRQYGEQAQDMARSAVKERPMAVIVAAVMLGFALGALWR